MAIDRKQVSQDGVYDVVDDKFTPGKKLNAGDVAGPQPPEPKPGFHLDGSIRILNDAEAKALRAGVELAHNSGGAHSKATTTNPKDLLGAVKVSLTKLPAVAVMHGAHAMMDGVVKYGPYNWRDKKVLTGIYIDAARRHIDSWFEGQEIASDSEVHHLGHAIACLAIILDAQETGNLEDDRPVVNGQRDTADRVFIRLSETIKRRAAAKAKVG